MWSFWNGAMALCLNHLMAAEGGGVLCGLLALGKPWWSQGAVSGCYNHLQPWRQMRSLTNRIHDWGEASIGSVHFKFFSVQTIRTVFYVHK
jgi:hypothetical protein